MNAETKEIGGHKFTLESGRRYLASRPIASRGQKVHRVEIRDITEGGFRFDGRIVDAVNGLNLDQANALLAAFNNCETSFMGRVW